MTINRKRTEMSLENKKRVDRKLIDSTVNQLQRRIDKRLEQYGNRSFASRHEIFGLIAEEYYELINAVQTDKTKHIQHIRGKLFDIAVACVWGILSIETNSTDW